MDRQVEESCCVPPGFRFHPTEEELVGYYLARKVASHKIDLDIIQEVDLYRIEPWDLPHAGTTRGGLDDQTTTTTTEWYFFSYKDRKYPSGTRTNRATAAGFWKATGRDKPVLSCSSSRVIGMRKTLVFYRGRAPNGRKTDWIMHEYRLHQAPAQNQEEGWVVCRAFQKPIPNQQRPPFFPSYGAATPAAGYYDDLGGSSSLLHPGAAAAGNSFPPPQLYSDNYLYLLESKTKQQHLFRIPPLVESPTAGIAAACCAQAQQRTAGSEEGQAAGGGIDWNFLDTLLLSSTTTSQLHEPSITTLLQ